METLTPELFAALIFSPSLGNRLNELPRLFLADEPSHAPEILVYSSRCFSCSKSSQGWGEGSGGEAFGQVSTD
ncbi:hypothetical protein XELAEV_18008526mg [Xenopus laevis]|uniref:Uncharacterized protein n=1 Tax=Xenopus laevis TaxID=8355 RepID=A0A974E4S4_XENLA|nr:hypothetical protein XELAEV_18008526mg [Xenopus laevis]